ncbi:MAG: hypothetical protein M1828_002832 [Chrysothrix sp. TS-e1954]|nr:MAG: hypothetical protein M1828_002832 [Chrysothrix sp. TS-e1954]
MRTDSVLPKSSSSGREQATISWETTFSAGTNEADEEDLLIQLPWKLFKPTYRGKEVKDVEPLNKSSVMSISIMARSMFGAQQGPFSVTLVSIAAYASEKRESQKAVDDVFPYPYHDQMRFDSFNEKRDPSEIAPKRAHNSFWSTICCSSEQ